MDEKSFYGGVLHVCYVPEYETVEDTRLKLQDRRRYVIRAFQNKGRIRRIRKLCGALPFLKCSFEIVLCFASVHPKKKKIS